MKMFKKILYTAIIFNIFSPSMAFCLEKDEIIRLRKAGLAGETINIVISKRVIETCAFSIDEIVELKKAGFDAATMQKIIKEGSFLKDENAIVYGKNLKSIKMITVMDVIELKNAGLSDEVIRSIITYRSKSSSEKDREEAWEMLKNIGIIVEKRKRH